jgi:maltooligosyltrehalose synthase
MSNIEHHGLVLPSNPEDRRKLLGGIDEMINCLAQMDAQRDQKKEIVEHLYQSFDIDKKLLNKAAATIYKDNFQKVAAENEDLELLVEALKIVEA